MSNPLFFSSFFFKIPLETTVSRKHLNQETFFVFSQGKVFRVTETRTYAAESFRIEERKKRNRKWLFSVRTRSQKSATHKVSAAAVFFFIILIRHHWTN